jgi:hypothetical protein
MAETTPSAPGYVVSIAPGPVPGVASIPVFFITEVLLLFRVKAVQEYRWIFKTSFRRRGCVAIKRIFVILSDAKDLAFST